MGEGIGPPKRLHTPGGKAQKHNLIVGDAVYAGFQRWQKASFTLPCHLLNGSAVVCRVGRYQFEGYNVPPTCLWMISATALVLFVRDKYTIKTFALAIVSGSAVVRRCAFAESERRFITIEPIRKHSLTFFVINVLKVETLFYFIGDDPIRTK